MKLTFYFERALFIVGERNDGKSTQLRSMFRDWRLGNQGIVPSSSRLREHYALSNERWLYLRLSSPHEGNDKSLKGFLAYSKAKMQQKNVPARRWNFAGALQISATTKIPAADEVVAGFSKYFRPERIRVVLLSPNSRGNHLPQGIWTALTSKLNLIPEVEIVTVDASKKNANGLIYSDFFDFT